MTDATRLIDALQWKRGDTAYRPIADSMEGNKLCYKDKANGPFKIMGVIDGYAMCRFPRCSPFTVALSALRKTPEECVYVR